MELRRSECAMLHPLIDSGGGHVINFNGVRDGEIELLWHYKLPQLIWRMNGIIFVLENPYDLSNQSFSLFQIIRERIMPLFIRSINRFIVNYFNLSLIRRWMEWLISILIPDYSNSIKIRDDQQRINSFRLTNSFSPNEVDRSHGKWNSIFHKIPNIAEFPVERAGRLLEDLK